MAKSLENVIFNYVKANSFPTWTTGNNWVKIVCKSSAESHGLFPAAKVS